MRSTNLIAAVAVVTLPVFLAPPAGAQIPAGLNPASVQSMIPSTINVPAGQTTTVDLGVPVNASYAGDGWSVSSAGTSVSVTAPQQPGSTISVPVSAAGMSATVTLVAEDVAAPAPAAGEPGAPGASNEPEGSVPAAGGSGGSGGGGQDPATGTQNPATRNSPSEERGGETPDRSTQQRGASQGSASTPERMPAAPVRTDEARRLHFEGEIVDNRLIVQVSIAQAADLLPLADTNRDGLKLRYLDVNGQIIDEDIQRDIDIAERTLTLTYPEGRTPDNPFIIEVVRDDNVAEFIATITATNAPVATAEPAEGEESSPYGDIAAAEGDEQGSESGIPTIAWIAIGGVALLIALLAAIMWAVRGRKSRRKSV